MKVEGFDLLEDPAYVIPGVDGEGNVWFRIYPQDSAWARLNLKPGAKILIHARVGEYWARGGYGGGKVVTPGSGEVGQEESIFRDRIGLDIGSIKILGFEEEVEEDGSYGGD